MIELKKEGSRLYLNGEKIPPLDINIMQKIIENGLLGAHELMMKMGKLSESYISLRCRTLQDYGLLIKPRYGRYDINPEIRDELKSLIEKVRNEESRNV